jgi:hypothetical protein
VFLIRGAGCRLGLTGLLEGGNSGCQLFARATAHKSRVQNAGSDVLGYKLQFIARKAG